LAQIFRAFSNSLFFRQILPLPRESAIAISLALHGGFFAIAAADANNVTVQDVDQDHQCCDAHVNGCSGFCILHVTSLSGKIKNWLAKRAML
jgi:hypothetical protein